MRAIAARFTEGVPGGELHKQLLRGQVDKGRFQKEGKGGQQLGQAQDADVAASVAEDGFQMVAGAINESEEDELGHDGQMSHRQAPVVQVA